MYMELHITTEDIQSGVRYSTVSCPIANALRRKYPGKYVAVTPLHARVFESYGALEPHPFAVPLHVFAMDTDGQNFIAAFDHGENPNPQTVHLWQRV